MPLAGRLDQRPADARGGARPSATTIIVIRPTGFGPVEDRSDVPGRAPRSARLLGDQGRLPRLLQRRQPPGDLVCARPRSRGSPTRRGDGLSVGRPGRADGERRRRLRFGLRLRLGLRLRAQAAARARRRAASSARRGLAAGGLRSEVFQSATAPLWRYSSISSAVAVRPDLPKPSSSAPPASVSP